MRKTLKIIGITLLSLIIIYALFITEESIRLKKEGEKPLIILGGTCEKLETTEKSYKTNCKGLGYSLKKEYLLGGQIGDESIGHVPVSEEFLLFDHILIWGWIA
jgi:hypothetical protein